MILRESAVVLLLILYELYIIRYVVEWFHPCCDICCINLEGLVQLCVFEFFTRFSQGDIQILRSSGLDRSGQQASNFPSASVKELVIGLQK